ncbi:MAG: hypothetical protein CMG58_04650 [Candidatus Marinimicrobia bacterium]|nr:hypothetical protein [Candidatus Neomarinimicrobiota bacterium]
MRNVNSWDYNLRVKLICATTTDGFIARHSTEITTWTKDLLLFKQQTMNKTVIMGSNTFNTLEGELNGRNVVVVTRKDSPEKIIQDIAKKETECFIAGGGRTNSRFADYITDLYLTPHPLLFGKGVPLFYNETINAKTRLVKAIPVPNTSELYQYHFSVIK